MYVLQVNVGLLVFLPALPRFAGAGHFFGNAPLVLVGGVGAGFPLPVGGTGGVGQDGDALAGGDGGLCGGDDGGGVCRCPGGGGNVVLAGRLGAALGSGGFRLVAAHAGAIGGGLPFGKAGEADGVARGARPCRGGG